MSTVVLVGLLVVVLVAGGVAAFLRRWRGRDRAEGGSDPSAPPRTVGELVDRRRAGADPESSDVVKYTDGAVAAGGYVTSAPAGPTADLAAGSPAEDEHAARSGTDDRYATPVQPVDDATTPIATSGPATPTPGDTGYDGGRAATADTAGIPHPGGVPGAATGTATGDSAVEPGAGAATDTGAATATRDAATGETAGADTATGTDAAASEETGPIRPGSDVDDAPAGPPWRRGFVNGRQVAPAPARRRPDAAAPAGAAGDVPDPTGAAPQAGADRPSAPPRQDSRSPVDPDLVKRVTAVPGERSACRTADPDTEEEFRAARERMTGQASARSGRVPEQASRSPESEPGRRPSPVPVSRSATPAEPGSGTTAGGASGAATAGVAGAGAVGAAGLGAVTLAATRSATAETTGEPTDSGPDRDDAPAPEATAHVAPRPDAAGPYGAGSDAADPDAIVSDVDGSDAPGPQTSSEESIEAVSGAEPGTPSEEPSPRPAPRVMRSSTPVDRTDDRADDRAGSDEPVVDPEDGENTGTETTTGTTPSGGSAEPVPADRPRDAGPETVVALRSSPASRREPVPGTPAQDVDVRVADQGATPLSGVAVAMLDGTGTRVGSRTTGTDGGARLRAPGAGQYVLVSSATGYQPGVTPCAVADDPVRVTITLSGAATVHGVVRSASGDARPGVPVLLEQDGQTVADADTGSDGGFRFGDLTAGEYLLSAGRSEQVVSTVVHLRVGSELEQDLRLVPAGGRA